MKKLNKYKEFLVKKFESKGFYISHKWLKPKKKKEKKEVVYLKTEGYIIPEPSPDAFDKEKKPKYKFFNKDQFNLYKKLDITFDPYFGSAAILFFHKNVYNIGVLKNFSKFSFIIKFDFLRTMSHLGSFYNFSSFGLFYVKLYYSIYNSKLINHLIFKDFFTIFINHNKPFIRKKGKRYIGKKRGTAYVLIGGAIYGQIIYEYMKLPFEFSNTEKKNFGIAEVDPYDEKYYWPTGGLNLIGLSTHSGKILGELTLEKIKIKNKFDYFKSIVEKNFGFKVLSQIFFWREILLNLFINNLIFFDLENFFFSETYNNFYNENLNIEENNFKSIPNSFFGKKNIFFSKNFIFENNDELPLNLQNFILKSKNHDIYKLLSFHSSLLNFNKILNEKIKKNKFIKLNNKIGLLINNKIVSNEIIENFKLSKHLYFDCIELKNLTINFFNKYKLDNEKSKLYSLPIFLGILFYLLTFNIVDLKLLEKYIVFPLLQNNSELKEIMHEPYIFNDLYNKKLNFFKISIFKNLQLKERPAIGHKLFHANLSTLLKTEVSESIDNYLKSLKFFNIIFLLEKNNIKNLTLSNAITPAGLINLQLFNLNLNNGRFKQLKKKYNVIILFNIFFFFKKILKINKINFYKKLFCYNYMYILVKTKKKYKSKNFKITEITNRYINRFKFFVLKPQEFQNFENSKDYANWFSNFFDPMFEQFIDKKLIKNLNFCLPKIILLNIEKYSLTNNNISKKILIHQKQKLSNIGILYLKKLQKGLYKNFLIRLLTPRFWLNIFFKNINFTQISKSTFYFFNNYMHISLIYSNMLYYNYNKLNFDKFGIFGFIEKYYLINNIFINQQTSIYIRLKKYDKNKFSK